MARSSKIRDAGDAVGLRCTCGVLAGTFFDGDKALFSEVRDLRTLSRPLEVSRAEPTDPS